MPQNTDSAFSAKALADLKIVVAGDIMLDRYIYGDVSRISPEAPVPVLAANREAEMLGGAGNVLSNLAGLGVRPHVVALIGDDAAGEKIKQLCAEKSVAANGLLVVQNRPSAEKTRYVGNGQQMLRVDHEKPVSLSGADEDRFIALLKEQLNGAKVLVLSDYGKGALTNKVLSEAIVEAKKLGVTVLVDPKGADYSRYRGADVVTPNRKELGEATANLPNKTDSEIAIAAQKLLELSGIKSVVATRSADGMSVLADKSGKAVHLKTQAREVYDVSGAGDTVIATIAAGLGLGLSLVDAATIANRAAGIVVAQAGTTSIKLQDLIDESEHHSFLSWEAGREQIRAWQAQGLKVGFTNGCFDILHAGHVLYLKEAASYCDRLVLGLNHDKSVKILKGPTRPVNDEESRATVMAGLGSISLVVLFGAETVDQDNTPAGILDYLRPDIIFKGGDYTEDQLPEAKVVRAYGGEVKIMGLTEGKSTTNIINKIAAA